VLPIAPSTYSRLRRAGPILPCARSGCDGDDALCIEVRHVFNQNKPVYGVRKVCRRLRREGLDVARCTVARLMRRLSLARRGAGQGREDDRQRHGDALSARPGESAGPGRAVELATLDWVDWFNHRRLPGSIGSIPPADAEAADYRQQAALPKAA
jgi:transposase InsO family protein